LCICKSSPTCYAIKNNESFEIDVDTVNANNE